MKKQFWIKDNRIFEYEIINFDYILNIELESISERSHVFYFERVTYAGGKILLKDFIKKDLTDSNFSKFANGIKIHGYKFDDCTFIIRFSIKNSTIIFNIYKSGMYEFIGIENYSDLTFFEKIKNWFK